MNPSVSVVLPVYNCPEYVGEAIESILGQTHSDFELILIDDGSTDDTPRVLERYADPRIRLLRQQNRGLAVTLNRGIELARGRYVARQDQDDVSMPARFAAQVKFLDEHPRCGLVGTWAEIWRERRPTGRSHRHPAGNLDLQLELLLDNPFVHSSVMIRKSALDRVGSYCLDPERQPPEDFELWSRIAREYEVANIPIVLHIYREVRGSMSRFRESPFRDRLVKISAENIALAAGVDPLEPQVVNIAAIAHGSARAIEVEPDFEVMLEHFLRAVENVAGAEAKHFIPGAKARIRGLRWRLWELRHSHGWQRRVLWAVRGIARALNGRAS